MTTKEHREMARRLAVRGIEAYKQKLIYEEDLLNGEDKRRILEQIDVIRDSIKFDKVAELERELAKERKKSKDLQARLDWLHSLNDCDEEFEL
jgi:dienelactone hydrolase